MAALDQRLRESERLHRADLQELKASGDSRIQELQLVFVIVSVNRFVICLSDLIQKRHRIPICHFEFRSLKER